MLPHTAGRRRYLAAVLLLTAAVAYSMWLLELALPTQLSPVSSFVSEHYVVSQPYHRLFRCTDVIAGPLYLTAAVTLCCRMGHRRSTMRYGCRTPRPSHNPVW